MNGSKSNVKGKQTMRTHSVVSRSCADSFLAVEWRGFACDVEFFTELLCMQVASETLLPNGESVVRLVDSSYTMQRDGSDASVGIEFQCRKTETAMVRESYGMMPSFMALSSCFSRSTLEQFAKRLRTGSCRGTRRTAS